MDTFACYIEFCTDESACSSPTKLWTVLRLCITEAKTGKSPT